MVAALSFASRGDRRRVDDDDDLYDPKYPGQRVIRDGKGVRVRLELTDAQPPEYRAAMSRRPMLFDARAHQPHYITAAGGAELRDAERRAVEARDAWVRGLQDAWRNPIVTSTTPSAAPAITASRPSGAMSEPPDNSADDPDEDSDDPVEAARALYIKHITGAWRQKGPYAWAEPGPRMMGPQHSPPVPYGHRNGGNGNGNGADANQRDYIRQTSPGAKPGAYSGGGRAPSGVTFGQHDPSRFPSQDALVADADQAYAEYCNRIANAWRS